MTWESLSESYSNFRQAMEENRMTWESLSEKYPDLRLNPEENLLELHSRWMSHLKVE